MTITMLMGLVLILAIVFLVLILAIVVFAMIRNGGYDFVSFICLGVFFGATLMFFMGMVIIS